MTAQPNLPRACVGALRLGRPPRERQLLEVAASPPEHGGNAAGYGQCDPTDLLRARQGGVVCPDPETFDDFSDTPSTLPKDLRIRTLVIGGLLAKIRVLLASKATSSGLQ